MTARVAVLTPDPIVLGQQAERAMEQFLAPAFEEVAEAYTIRLGEVAAAEPWATDKIVKLALANRVLKEVRAQVEYLITNGRLERDRKAAADKIAAIPIEKRRIANY